MKRLSLPLLVAILTFLFGVGLDGVVTSLYGERTPQIQKLESTTLKVEKTQLTTLAPITTPTPHLIFDYDPEKFNPRGDYYIIGRKPKEFRDFDSLELVTRNPGNWESEYIMIQSYVNNTYEAQGAVFGLVTEQHLFFITQPFSDEAFEYKFDGTFLRGGVISKAAEGEMVLRGKLTKSKHGRKIAEHVVTFRVEYLGC